MKMIVYYVRLYRKCMKEANTDILGNASELALHYKTEIVKYAFMLAINAIEFIAVLTLESGFGFSLITNYEKFDNCTETNIDNLYDFRVTANPFAAVPNSFGEAGFLFSLALVTCLMKYLDVIYHDIHGNPFMYVRRFLLVSCFVGMFLIITGSMSHLFILQEIFEPVITMIYFYIWVKQTRTFYKTLRWRCAEYKIRGMSHQIVRRSISNCRHFTVIMSMIGIGTLCLILFIIIDKGFFIITIAIHYGPCLFHHLYGTPLYKPILASNQRIQALLNLSIEIVSWTGTVLLLVAHLSVGLPYLFASIGFFGAKLWKSLKYRFGKVRTRFTPSLTDPLLIT